MIEFRALHTTSMTEEIANNLEVLLNNLPGIQQFAIGLDTQEFRVVFDEKQLGFQSLINEIAKAGCPLHSINAALFFPHNPSKV